MEKGSFRSERNRFSPKSEKKAFEKKLLYNGIFCCLSPWGNLQSAALDREQQKKEKCFYYLPHTKKQQGPIFHEFLKSGVPFYGESRGGRFLFGLGRRRCNNAYLCRTEIWQNGVGGGENWFLQTPSTPTYGNSCAEIFLLNNSD